MERRERGRCSFVDDHQHQYINITLVLVTRSESPSDPIQDLTFLKGSAGVLALAAVYEGDAKDIKVAKDAQANQALRELLHMANLLHQRALYAPLGLTTGYDLSHVVIICCLICSLLIGETQTYAFIVIVIVVVVVVVCVG